MLKSYFMTAVRSLMRDRFYSGLNILGLAVGLAVCMLIFLFVRHELDYERQFSRAERIYRVGATFATQQVNSEEAKISYLAADLLRAGFPDIIEETAQLVFVGDASLFSRDTQRFYENQFFVGDPAFFTLFDFPFLAGDPATALDQPNSVVLTKHVAEAFFGRENPLGQTITYNNRVELRVTGVIADMDSTHLAIDLVASKASLVSLYGSDVVEEMQGWGWPSTYTYILLAEGADIGVLQAGIREFEARNNVQEQLDIFFQPLREIHLHSQLELEMQANGNVQTVWVFTLIAVLILCIASINFMNLATARSTLRAREVGMRKAVGAYRAQLVCQFMGEALLLTLLAMVVGLALLELLLPPFNTFVGKSLGLGHFSDWRVPAGLLGFALMVALGAGCYPALFLSRVMPVSVLRGGTHAGRNGRVRKGLVIVQFAISIALLVCTAVIVAQMQYARSLDLGYDREAVVVINTEGSLAEPGTYEALRQDLLQIPAVRHVSMADIVPTDPVFAGTGFRLAGQPDMEAAFLRVNPVGVDFFESLDMELVAGRTFSDAFAQDVRDAPTEANPHVLGNMIMNEAAVEKFGWTPGDALGKQLVLGGDRRSITYTVVGVVRDVQYASLDYAIEPLVYGINGGEVQRNMIVKIAGTNLARTLADVDAAWNRVVPGYPITRTFLAEKFNALMAREQRSAILMGFFSALAVLISCLGILGLAAFMTVQRRREIGVRKVMGSSVWRIVLLLTNDFSKLVLLANVIAWPVAYFAMSRWLENFVYRIDLTPVVFIGSGLIVLCIAWVTVGGTAAKAANQKPVLALRYE